MATELNPSPTGVCYASREERDRCLRAFRSNAVLRVWMNQAMKELQHTIGARGELGSETVEVAMLRASDALRVMSDLLDWTVPKHSSARRWRTTPSEERKRLRQVTGRAWPGTRY